MPGGSVNGRPFRESIHSYKYTGVPCGNPSRYVSSDVVRMDAKSSRYQTVDGPVEVIETEGERQLKSLVKKQLDTNVTLNEQLSKRKAFSTAVSYKPLVEKLSGIVELSSYKKVEGRDSEIEDLRHCGLTEDEIQQTLHNIDDVSHTTKKRFKIEPNILAQNSKEIEKKIQLKHDELALPDKVSGAKTIGRHQMDLEKSVIKGSERSKFLSNVLTNQKAAITTETLHPDHPMNHIPNILHTLEHSFYHRRHKRRKFKGTETVVCGPLNKVVCHSEERIELAKPLEVATEISVVDTKLSDAPQNLQGPKHTEEASMIDTVPQTHPLPDGNKSRHNPAVCNLVGSIDVQKLTGKIDQIPDHVIQKYRLKEEEIRKIPRFENYTPGKSKNVLYLKNLAPKVSKEDLVSLFSRFQKAGGPNIVYRLLTGRMKGQAFVTFDNCETAELALKLVNGYHLKGKPIIIQYGNKGDTM